MCVFLLRCITVARTEKTFNNFMRNKRYQMLDLQYDFEMLKELYMNKETESKQALQNNINELQDEYDTLWRKYRAENEGFKQRQADLFEREQAFYAEKTAELEEKIEKLEIKRVDVEHAILDLKDGKYKEKFAQLEKYEEFEAKKKALKDKLLLKNLFKLKKAKK